MSEQVKEDNQKTVVSFVVGLLIGGLLVWAFSGNADSKPVDKIAEDIKTETPAVVTETEVADETPAVAKLPVGTGAAKVEDENAGRSVSLDSVTFPAKEGWVGVRNLSDGKLGMLLGVARFSEEQGLIPKDIQLMTPTVSGRDYAIVFYSESGDRKFNLANDVQLEGEFATFTAK